MSDTPAQRPQVARDLQAHPADLQHLVTRIVAAYTAHHALAVADLPDLIRTTAQALLDLGKPPAPAAEPAQTQKPAVPVRRSVTPEHIVCLDCGTKTKMLKRHLEAAHGLTTEEYRARWGLPAEYPLVAPLYAAQRSELARATGLGTKGGRQRVEPEPATERVPVAVPKGGRQEDG